jgi:hypothetical protein
MPLGKGDLIEFEGTVQEFLPDARPIATRHTLHDLAARETISLRLSVRPETQEVFQYSIVTPAKAGVQRQPP